MKRTLLVIGFIVAGCIAVGSASAATATPAPQPVVEKATATPALDPFQGGDVKTRVPMAPFCQNTLPSQCEQLPDGDKCDTPKGCVCGWTPTGRKCGRF